MPGYYVQRLSAERLRRCYELASPRIRQYLDAEIAYVAGRIRPSDRVLELGCGYGRCMLSLASRAGTLIGVDVSASSLHLARDYLSEQVYPNDADPHYDDAEQNRGPARKDHGERPRPHDRPNHVSRCHLVQMDARTLAFRDASFDVVFCIQNGLSAFNVEPHALLHEAVRVTRPGGRALFSSYAEPFWPHRLAWFRLQARYGLIGPIDEAATGDGAIVCVDGFRATTFGPVALRALTADLNANVHVEEVDGSSVFCELHVT